MERFRYGKAIQPMRKQIDYIFQEYLPTPLYHRMKNIFKRVFYAGSEFVCPCCGNTLRTFLPFGNPPRPNAMCPFCISLERHRLLILYLQRATTLFIYPHRLLHMAPNHAVRNVLEQHHAISYFTADLMADNVALKTNITALPYPDKTFDAILCNHVLEHIPDDHIAMQELYRVLKPGAWAILQVPIDTTRATTFEDPSITDPHQRERLFGQQDHVRVYGRDYTDRLQHAGFTVKIDPFVRTLSEAEQKKYGLSATEDIYLGSRPA
jgi:SAM-dependent methyltransferase